MAPLQSHTGEPQSADLTQVSAIAIGAGLGGFMLLISCGLLFMVIRKRKEYNRAISIRSGSQRQYGRSIDVLEYQAHLNGYLKASTTSLCTSKSGWKILSSKESVVEVSNGRGLQQDRLAYSCSSESHGAALSAPKNATLCRTILLKQAKRKHLSTITESPLINKVSTSSAKTDSITSPSSAATGTANLDCSEAANVIARSGSSNEALPILPEVPPRAFLPTRKYGRCLDMGTMRPSDSKRPIAVRSFSTGTFLSQLPQHSTFTQVARAKRPILHDRSMSFGATVAGPAPTGPLPPLPQGLISVLKVGCKDPLEDLIDSKKHDDTNLKGTKIPVAYEERCISRKSPGTVSPLPECHRSSVCSTTARFSLVSLDSACPPGPKPKTPDHVSASSTSSSGSLNDHSVGRMTSKHQVSRVTATGSPAERRRSSVLHRMSGDRTPPPGYATQSARSPTLSSSSKSFQWDSTPKICRPSAMKGSPGARKGHKRQNCVRISTLAPTILGPYIRSTSPSLDGIAKEIPDGAGILITSPRKELRPPSRVHQYSDHNLDPTKLRASLTPSSPTLSLPLLRLDWYSSSRPSSSGSYRRSQTVISSESSLSSLESYKADIPTFEFTRPSTDLDSDRDKVFAVQITPDEAHMKDATEDVGCAGQKLEHATSWPLMVSETLGTSQRCNVKSPVVDCNSLKSSSRTFPFVKSSMAFASSPTETVLTRKRSLPPLSPPCSPKTIPALVYPSLAETAPIEQSAVKNVLYTGAILPISPSESSEPQGIGRPLQSPLSAPTTRQISIMQPLIVLNGAAMQSQSDGLSKSSDTAPAKRESRNVQGPRSQPAREIRKSIITLRRMNSDIQLTPDGTTGARRYLKLGREASPLLPFSMCYEDPEDNEGFHMAGGFDFGFRDTGGFFTDFEDSENIENTDLEAQSSVCLPSVWDNGEISWMHKGLSSPRQSDAKTGALTPRARSPLGGVRISPNAAATTTPKSLYDADGFLKIGLE